MNLQIEPVELSRRLDSPEPPALLDVREPEEHAFVALANSRLIPLGELEARLDELDDWRDREIVVYCHHGIRSMHAIARLRASGFTRLRNLRGGIDRWSLDINSTLPRY